MTYHEFRFWSAELGCDASRLSIRDRFGGEHFMIIAMDGKGKQNRQSRSDALDLIAEHINQGQEPGRVELATN